MKGTNIAAAVASRHAPVTRPGVDREAGTQIINSGAL